MFRELWERMKDKRTEREALAETERLDKAITEAVAGYRLVQIVVDGNGEDATLIGLTESGQLYRSQLWGSEPWQELDTPQSEILAGWETRVKKGPFPPNQ